MTSAKRPQNPSSRCTPRLQFQTLGIWRFGSSAFMLAQGAIADAVPPAGFPRLPFSYEALSENGGLLTRAKYRLPSGRSKNNPAPPRTAVLSSPNGFHAKLKRGAQRF